MNYRRSLEQLEKDIVFHFNQLCKTMEFDFVQNLCEQLNKEEYDCENIGDIVEVDAQGFLPEVEIRNELTGDIFTIYICSVSKDGIIGIDMQDTSTDYRIQFDKLASIEDKITLIEEISKTFI